MGLKFREVIGMINEAIQKACNYNETLNQREYDELLKDAKISGFQGREACDAIATAVVKRQQFLLQH